MFCGVVQEELDKARRKAQRRAERKARRDVSDNSTIFKAIGLLAPSRSALAKAKRKPVVARTCLLQ